MSDRQKHLHSYLRRHGTRVVHLLEDVGLSIVLVATVVATVIEVQAMWVRKEVLLTDLLLMFIYIEMVTMVKVYWQSGKLPVRMPLYVAIVAMARYLIIEIKDMEQLRVLTVSASILVLALAVLVIRWGHLKLPYAKQSLED